MNSSLAGGIFNYCPKSSNPALFYTLAIDYIRSKIIP